MELTGALSHPFVSEVLLLRLTELCQVALSRKRPSAIRAVGCMETPGVWRQAGEPLPTRPGTVLAAVTHLLESARRPTSVAEIHAGVASATGAAVARSSVKSALASHCSGAKARFRRVRSGVYALQQS